MAKIISPNPKVVNARLTVYDGTGNLWQNPKVLGIVYDEPKQLAGTRRGAVRGFSYHAAHRMRKYMLGCDYSKPCLGVTLTSAPWATRSPEQAFDGLSKHLRRCSGIGSMIWRKEVTAAGLSHYHTICFVDGDGDLLDLLSGIQDLVTMWVKYLLPSVDIEKVKGLTSNKTVLNYLRAKPEQVLINLRNLMYEQHMHGGGVSQPFRGRVKALQYMLDHSSKHKAYQAMTHGRAWGVVNKSNVPRALPLGMVQLPDDCVVPMQRFLARLSRKPVAAPCVFGSRLAYGRRYTRGEKVTYGIGNGALRYAQWLKDEYERSNKPSLPIGAPSKIATPSQGVAVALQIFEGQLVADCLSDR